MPNPTPKPIPSHLACHLLQPSQALPSPLAVLVVALVAPVWLPGIAVADDAIVPVPPAMTIQNIPDIPAQATADLRAYENIRTAGFQDWHPKERSMLISTRFAETNQLHEVGQPGGMRHQLTFFDEPVSGGSYRPGNPDHLVFSYNEGGAENYQLFFMNRTTGKISRFSDGEHRYQGMLWSHGGHQLTFTSNERNGRDFDMYTIDPADPSTKRRVAELEGLWWASDWSHDDWKLLVIRYISANESHPYILDVRTGELTRLPGTEPDPDGVQVSYGGGLWAKDDRSIFMVTDRGSEFQRLMRVDLQTGTWSDISGDQPWNVSSLDISDDGRRLVYVTNEDGMGKLHAINPTDGLKFDGPDLPPGVVGSISFRPNSHEIAFTFSWAQASRDIYSFNIDTTKMERWTKSEIGGLSAEGFSIPKLVRFPTFDTTGDGETRTIPAFVYQPDPQRHPGKRPVYISIHGGPEGQSRPGFRSRNNYLINDLGITIIYPNVRGSTGYGKSYLKLDNGRLRENSVRDIGALLDWVETQDDLDSSRVMVGGGSYGGYMSLATMVHYGDRLRAGFDYVGISNFVTFLRNTKDYRRDLRRVEYGDESDPEMAEFLQTISPSNRATEISIPMLVAQGANDPRVPLSEAEQIVEAVSGQDIPVWYLVAGDEGHGFSKKTNADYLWAVRVEFMKRYLLGDGDGADGP